MQSELLFVFSRAGFQTEYSNSIICFGSQLVPKAELKVFHDLVLRAGWDDTGVASQMSIFYCFDASVSFEQTVIILEREIVNSGCRECVWHLCLLWE